MLADTKQFIVDVCGETSEKLADVLQIESFFEFKTGRTDNGIVLQRQATKLIEDAYSQFSA